MDDAKRAVQEFWDRASCGEELYLRELTREGYRDQALQRYALEPYIPDFANFTSFDGQKVLEIGIGLGADHQRFVEAGAETYGLDLTPRAVTHVKRRLAAFGLESHLIVGDAEKLSFPDAAFDAVYSWGVLHHSPDTPKAIAEVMRVLRPGGVARVMMYHKWSLVGYMLWIRYALMRLRPWRTLTDIYANHLESPGTKAYTIAEARKLFAGWSKVDVEIVLTHGDLLESGAGARHRGVLLNIARMLMPRKLVKKLAPRHGLFMLISAVR
jgi:SAM-dependent methyltransferase